MNRLRLIPRIETPPDDFRYVFPQDGVLIRAIERKNWFEKIADHYRMNNYERPEDWKEQAEAQLCSSMPPGWCKYEDGGEPKAFINRRFNFGDAVNGTNVLIEFVAQGAPLVPQELAESRARTCAACFALMQIPGCTSCSKFADMVARVSGARKTKADPILDSKACGVCACSAQANVWIPVEVSKAGVTQEMMDLFPSHCWKKQEILALDQK